MKFLIRIIFCILAAANCIAADDANQHILSGIDCEVAMRDSKWSSVGAIGVGDGFSLSLQTQPAHSFLAEYFQRVFLFSGSKCDGKFVAAFQLRMNTGGRTHVLLYRILNQSGSVIGVSFLDRYGEQVIDLVNMCFADPTSLLSGFSKKEYLGLVSGEAYPLKFITSIVITEDTAISGTK